MEYPVSVIVPAYNCEKTLSETVDSLLGQTVNIQVIIVDDGSSDGTAEIADSYAGEHENITVLHRANGGVSSARNAGLAAAKGKYVIFLDADDLLTPETARSVYNAMEKAGSSCALFRLSRFGFGGTEFNPAADELAGEKRIEYNDPRLLWTFLIGNKCFLRQALLDTRAQFPPTAYCEDGVFWMSFLMRCRQPVTGVYGAECRYRRQDPLVSRTVTQTMNIKLVRDFFTSCEMILAELDSDELKSEMHLKICRTVTNEFYRRLWQTDDEILALLEEGYGRYYSLLSPERKARLKAYDPDIGIPVFSKAEAARNPLISVCAGKADGDFIASLYNQSMPLFEIVTDNTSALPALENISSGKPRGKIKLRLKGKEILDPRLFRALVILRNRRPFGLLPVPLLRAAAGFYLRAKDEKNK